MTQDNQPNDINEAAIAGDEASEQDNWITVQVEETGETLEFLVDDVLDIEYKGEERSYAILIPQDEVNAIEAGTKEVAERIVIVRWVEDGDNVSTVPFEDDEEEQNALAAIEEYYQALEEDQATSAQ